MKENEKEAVLALDLDKHLLSIRFWKLFWKYFRICILIITSYLFIFEVDKDGSWGIEIIVFIFMYISLMIVFGLVPIVFYIQVNDNKVTARERSYNVLTVVQKCISEEKYTEVINHTNEIKLLNKTKPHPLLQLADSKGYYAGCVIANFNHVYKSTLVDYSEYVWEDTARHEYEPYAITSGQRAIYELLWPLNTIDIERVSQAKSSLNKAEIYKLKEKTDLFFDAYINNDRQSFERAEREADRTGRDVWEILNSKSDAFTEKEFLRQDKEKSDRETKEESDKQATAMGLYVGLTGRCPHCNERINWAARRCPHCTSMIR